MLRKVVILSLLITGIVCVRALAQSSEQGSVIRLDPALDAIVSADAKLEQLADVPGGFTREGPVWIRDGGYLIYTVRNGNRQPGSPPPTDSDIIKWDPRDGEATVLIKGLKTDGNTLDRHGRIIAGINIGEGHILRLEKDGKRSVLAREYEDKPINPNDLVYTSDGVLYFTSPRRYGSSDTPSVFMLKEGMLHLLSPTASAHIAHPNGLAFSPDEKHLYLTDNPRIMKFEVQPDKTLANGQVFFDMSNQKPLTNFPDGVKVDTKGNVYVTGPGGIWIISPEGKHLGIVLAPNRPASLVFGGEDGKTLFITSRPGLYRIALKVSGPLL